MRTRLAGAILAAFMGLNWLGFMAAWPGEGDRFRILVAVATVAPIGAAASVFLRPSGCVEHALRRAALSLGIFAFSGPFLLNEWIRGDNRYVWIINQGFPCNTMGSGPGFLWVAGSSWLFGLGALAFALAGGRGHASMLPGIGGGVALTALTALAMSPGPEVFAWFLGCR